MAKDLEVRICGSSYRFQLPPDLSEHSFLAIIDYVETKFENIKKRMIEPDVLKVWLLTALNIAEELFEKKSEYEKLTQVLKRIDLLIAKEEEREDLNIRFSS